MKDKVKINKDWDWIVKTDRYSYKNGVLEVAREVVDQNLKHLRNPSQVNLVEELNRILAEWRVR